jgi:hypothetical protein
MKIAIFRDVTLCSSVQVPTFSWWQKHYTASKRWNTTERHGLTYQNKSNNL